MRSVLTFIILYFSPLSQEGEGLGVRALFLRQPNRHFGIPLMRVGVI